jgi:hypothetical protein
MLLNMLMFFLSEWAGGFAAATELLASVGSTSYQHYTYI